jgi:chemotaxis signal transduction protein
VNSYPDFIEGVIALKNNVFPVIEFEYFLNKQKMIRHDENKIILIHGGNKDLGILVNDVYTIVELENQSFEKIYEDVPIFVTEINGEILIIPDFDLILNETEFPKAFDKVKDKLREKKN